MFLRGSKRNSEAEIFISILDAHKYAAYFEAETLLQDKNSVERSILMTVRRMFLIRDLWPDLSFREVRGLILILVRSACADILEEKKGTAPLDMDEIIPGQWNNTEGSMDVYIEPDSWAVLLDNAEHMNQKLMDIALLRYYFEFSFQSIGQLLNITPEAASYRLQKLTQQMVAGTDLGKISKEPRERWIHVQKEGKKFLEGILLRQWESRQKRPTPMEKIYLSARFESRVLRHIRNLFRGKEVVGKPKTSRRFWVGGALAALIVAGLFVWQRQDLVDTSDLCPRGCFLRVCHFLGWKQQKIEQELLQEYRPLVLPRGMVQAEEQFLDGCRWVTFSDGNRAVLLGIQRKEFDPSQLLGTKYVVERVEIQDEEARLLMGQEQTALLWQKDGICFCLLAQLDPLDLIGIAESVRRQ